MSGITLAFAEARLAEYLAAESAILLGQKFVINGRELDRANLGDVQTGIQYWQDWIARLSPSGGRGRTRYIVPEGYP